MPVNVSLDTIITNGWGGRKQQDGGSWGIKCPEFVRHLQKHAICWAGNCKQNRLSQLPIHLWHSRMPALVVEWQLSRAIPPEQPVGYFRRVPRLLDVSFTQGARAWLTLQPAEEERMLTIGRRSAWNSLLVTLSFLWGDPVGLCLLHCTHCLHSKLVVLKQCCASEMFKELKTYTHLRASSWSVWFGSCGRGPWACAFLL